MFEIIRYSPADKSRWNRYVAKAKNATFLFSRDYMDYHSDRFDDYSLLFYIGGRLHSLMPAHACGSLFATHQGLTYGGLIMDDNVSTSEVLQLFEELNVFLAEKGFSHVIYKPVPWVYHHLPSEEDLYAIFWKCHAKLRQRMSATVIFMDANLRWRKDHRRRLNDAIEAGVRVAIDDSLDTFWPLLEDNLQARFGAKPVHTLEEMKLLKSRFPEQIVQCNAYVEDRIIGGITFYRMNHVLHGQYSGTNDEGKHCGAMEAIYQEVMYGNRFDYKYLDFGTSNEQGGLILNEGLIGHKEGYGGRAVCYDTYEWTI